MLPGEWKSIKTKLLYNPFEKMTADQCSDQDGIIFQNCSLGGQNAAFIEDGDKKLID